MAYVHFPEEIHERIAKFLVNDVALVEGNEQYYFRPNTQTAKLLNYAKMGDMHRRGVMAAMRRRLAPYRWSNDAIMEWIPLFADLIRDLDLGKVDVFRFTSTPTCFPQLRKLTIFAATEHLSLLRMCPKLVEITVIFDKDKLFQIWMDLASSITGLDLKSIRLHFSSKEARRAIFYLPRRLLRLLREASPQVEHLMVTGLHSWTTAMQSLVTGYQSLKKVTMTGWVTENDLSFLKTLEEVDLVDPISVPRVAVLRETLTSLTELTHIKEEHLTPLISCANLRCLRVGLEVTAEEILLGAFDKLEELMLHWRHGFFAAHFEVSPYYYLLIPCPKFYKPRPNMLEAIVRSKPSLRTLKLHNVLIGAKELEDIVRIMGSRLENLEVPMDWQEEVTTVRLERALCALAAHCPNVRTFKLVETKVLHPYSRANTPVPASDEEKNRCLLALERVRRYSRDFISYQSLRTFIVKRFTDRELLLGCVWDLTIRDYP